MLGMLFPWANSKGAIAGVLGSVGIMTWICTGTQITKPYRDSLPRLISGCDNETLFAAGLLMNDSFIFNETMSSVIWQNTTMIIPVANAVTNPTL